MSDELCCCGHPMHEGRLCGTLVKPPPQRLAFTVPRKCRCDGHDPSEAPVYGAPQPAAGASSFHERPTEAPASPEAVSGQPGPTDGDLAELARQFIHEEGQDVGIGPERLEYRVRTLTELLGMAVAEPRRQLAELHAKATKHNPRPPSPELVAELAARRAETMRRIGAQRMLENLAAGLASRELLSPERLAEIHDLWGRWDDEREPQAKTLLQLELAEHVAGLMEHAEACAREMSPLSLFFVDERRTWGHGWHIVRAIDNLAAAKLAGCDHEFLEGNVEVIDLVEAGEPAVLWCDEASPDSVRDDD